MEMSKPIPGQSLTVEPRKYPYERPPEVSDPEEAMQLHIKRLQEDEMQQSLIDLVELDPEEHDIKTITTGLLRSAVANGVHSLDVSMIVAPVVHQQIKNILDDADVDYEEGLVDYKKTAKDRKSIDKAKGRAKAQRLLKQSKDVDLDKQQEEEVEEDGKSDKPPAFFSRRGKR